MMPSTPSKITSMPPSDTLELETGADPLLTMAPLWHGPRDRQMRIGDGELTRATRTPAGPATLSVRVAGRRVEARTWGPGAGELMARLPGLIGQLDDPAPLVPHHEIVAQLVHRLPGLRMTRGVPLLEALVPAIVSQKVTAHEALRSIAALTARHGEPAPGPLGLMLPPAAEVLAGLPYWAFHSLGIERRRADAIRTAAAAAPRLERALGESSEQGLAALTSLPGIGAWTATETVRLVRGDPDAVSVGDFNLPRLVCTVLDPEAGQPADDRHMLQLLEPYRGQRARVVLLIESGGFRLPRRAPRFAARSIAAI
jgi:3-methyladenine DNA glycosylase/8-oxoguanine DNA glycosylase